MPRELSDKNKDTKFSEGKWRQCDGITDDESWFYLRHYRLGINHLTTVGLQKENPHELCETARS